MASTVFAQKSVYFGQSVSTIIMGQSQFMSTLIFCLTSKGWLHLLLSLVCLFMQIEKNISLHLAHGIMFDCRIVMPECEAQPPQNLLKKCLLQSISFYYNYGPVFVCFLVYVVLTYSLLSVYLVKSILTYVNLNFQSDFKGVDTLASKLSLFVYANRKKNISVYLAHGGGYNVWRSWTNHAGMWRMASTTFT